MINKNSLIIIIISSSNGSSSSSNTVFIMFISRPVGFTKHMFETASCIKQLIQINNNNNKFLLLNYLNIDKLALSKSLLQ